MCRYLAIKSTLVITLYNNNYVLIFAYYKIYTKNHLFRYYKKVNPIVSQLQNTELYCLLYD